MASTNVSSAAKSAAIMSKPGKPELARIVPGLLQWFRQHHYQVVVDHETGPYAAGVEVLERKEMASRPLNFVVVLGGDGTLLAAGGPILMPSVDAFVVTPVSPHSLTHRALVVRDTAEIEIVVQTGDEEAYLSVDGQVGMPINDGDRIHCRKSEHKVKLLRIKR